MAINSEIMKELMKKLDLTKIGVYKRIEKIQKDLKIIDVEVGAYCLAFQNRIKLGKYNINQKTIEEVQNALRGNMASVISENVIKTKKPKSLSNTTQKTNQKKANHQKTNYDEEYFDNYNAKKTLSVIKTLDILQLSKFRIISNYVRYDDETINDLKNLKQKIVQSINPKTKGNSNFLIWGPSGSGKTYLIEEIARSNKDVVDYQVLNLAELNHKEFQLKLDKIEKDGKNCICLIDEIDSDSSDKWAYESLLTHLFPSSDRTFRVCFILAGSGGATLKEMKDKIKSKNKGTDCLSRISPTNEYTIPSLNVGDYLLVASSQVLNIANTIDREISAIDKLALFYIAVNPQFSSARQVSQLVVSAIGRMPDGEDRMKYDHLFDYGDPVNKEFWLKTKTLDPKLFNSFIHIKKN